MCSLNVNFFLLVLVVLPLALLEESSTAAQLIDDRKFSFTPKIKVEMFNKLPNGAPLTIHCKSKDDDLGTHAIKAGQSYYFQFRVNFFGTTLFFCGASWQGGHVVFDIYSADRDNRGTAVRCRKYCRWEAREDAVVGFRQDNQTEYDISLPWNH